MSHYRRANTPNATYFFTVVTYRRQSFLCDEIVRNALRNAIIKVQAQYPFEIDAWVLLPDHMHTIWTLPENDANFSLRWQLIKRYVTRECGATLNRPEWLNTSKTNTKNPLYGNADFGSIRYVTITIIKRTWIIATSTLLSTTW